MSGAMPAAAPAPGPHASPMGKKAAADGGNPGLVDGLFQDALRNLQRAVELDGGPSG